jgi:hypothetical protein
MQFWYYQVTYQCTHNQHCPLLVVVLPAGDDIPFLTVSAIAAGDLNGGEVRAEVSRQLIN